MNRVKTEPKLCDPSIRRDELHRPCLAPPGWEILSKTQESENNQGFDALRTGQTQSGASTLEPVSSDSSPVEDTSLCASPLCSAPISRQFWKTGNYEDVLASKSRVQSSQNYMHIHPKFLHSNATSHKWAFGAVAELLDNAIDEIQNGATFVIVDKISNPRDKGPVLLIQDNGGGMDPEAIRRCMSFGFSDKKSTSTIGQYGNGFKTSTMRLGADVIVFSRHVDNRTLTQSVGLLSYTYLSKRGLDRIVVPMVDYEFNMSSSTFEPVCRHGKEHFESNISTILQWSPFSTEADIIKQFDDVGSHGTKVIVYNLWLTDDGTLELDFESDPEDICLHDPERSNKIKSRTSISEEHIGNRYRYSLRIYLSILYLKVPQNFSIILRGKVVEHHSIALDLKFPELIMYRPQTGGTKEEVITTIGFLKEAPDVYIHGFNVYHKNRLILPFWHVVNFLRSRGRGVVGVLEANFIEPTHNKQDFERTSLFQKLESRLKEMTWEYWDCHCGLIGYNIVKKSQAPVSSQPSSFGGSNNMKQRPVSMNKTPDLGPPIVSIHARHLIQNGQSNMLQNGIKRTQHGLLSSHESGRKRIREESETTMWSLEPQPTTYPIKPSNQQDAVVMIKENNKLRAKCLEHEKAEEELNNKLLQLKRDLKEANAEYTRMLIQLQELEVCKAEK